MTFTYRQLLEVLKQFSEDQLDLSVTYYNADIDEYYPVDIKAADEEDSEDRLGSPEGVPHPIIVHLVDDDQS
tara:strand:+ start:2920 stop:3135 length:216 start_codon:yes stop_codon:yes gene_type:complete